MVSSLAEVKYLESDDFDQAVRVHIARLVTLSGIRTHRSSLAADRDALIAMSLHSNPTIFRYDFDILIADFGQARLIRVRLAREDAIFRLLIRDRSRYATQRYAW